MPEIRGEFDDKTLPQPAEPDSSFAAVARLLLDKRFHGPLDAVSRGQMLAVGGERAGASILASLGGHLLPAVSCTSNNRANMRKEICSMTVSGLEMPPAKNSSQSLSILDFSCPVIMMGKIQTGMRSR